jgi:multicomponent K+:H+ antiporter subunit E
MKTLRQRFLPAPLMSVVLAIFWPVLNQSWSLGQVLLGLLLAIIVPWFTDTLRTEKPRLRRPGVLLRLGLVVLKDIVTSNLNVARLIVGAESNIRPGFVWLPLRITDPHGIFALACIVTMTPGTLSAELAPDHKHLLIHAFNVDDEAALIATIQSRYEAPLMEIFT